MNTNRWLFVTIVSFRFLKDAAHVCIELMLQDDGDDQLTRALGLNACYNYYSIATNDDFKSELVDEDDEDIVSE
jgi:hypothetical protein